MKKTILLLLVWLIYYTGDSQSTPTITQPITTTGISLPQLITTNLNRSNLQFGVNLSEGLNRPNLSANFNKLISNEKIQFTFSSGVNLNHSFNFNDNENTDFYNVNSLSFNLDADLKIFNRNNYFLQIATQNRISKPGGISNFEHFHLNNSLTLGFGKGRIDYVNDGASALAIVEKLSKFGVINRTLTEFEYTQLIQKINALKNRRKFVNRSYPLTESEEIHHLLSSFGIVSADIDITPILNEAYKYEPIMDRTTGSQFTFSVTGSQYHSNFFSDFNNRSLSVSLSYMIHTPISSKWQYNRGVTAYFDASESNFDDYQFTDNRLKKAGIGITNNLHRIIDDRMRVSFLSTTGYNFKNLINTFDPIGNPFIDNKGFFMNLRSEFEHRLTRTTSTTFGINLNLTPDNISTGLNLGIKF